MQEIIVNKSQKKAINVGGSIEIPFEMVEKEEDKEEPL